MTTKTLKLAALTAATLLLTALPAHAALFNFQDLTGPASSLSGFLPKAGTSWSVVTTHDIAPSNTTLFGGKLTYESGGLEVAAQGFFSESLGGSLNDALVVQDHGGDAGLGVYSKHLSLNPAGDVVSSGSLDNSDDNVTGGSNKWETLRLTFNEEVTITGLTFRNANHNAYGSGSTNTYLFNGTEKTFGSSNAATPATGTVFTFAFGGSSANQFYLSTLTAVPTPDGGVTAIMLGSALIGLFAVRRRRSKQ